MPMLILLRLVGELSADEGSLIGPERKIRKTAAADAKLAKNLNYDFQRFSNQIFSAEVEAPPQPRVSRSRLPLRQIRLLGGDQFLGECLEWSISSAKFRLLNGQIIQLPTDAVAALECPPGEIDVVEESFGDQQGAEGVQLDTPYQKSLSASSLARIEFRFQAAQVDLDSAGGEWRLDWSRDQTKQPPILVRIRPGRRIEVSGIASFVETSTQLLDVSADWHSFIALFEQDRVRFIVDDAMLFTVPSPGARFDALTILPPNVATKNNLRIDNVQIRRLVETDSRRSSAATPINGDQVELASGDQLFGHLIGVDRRAAQFETFGERQTLPWSEIVGLSWRQPDKQVTQTLIPKTGIVAELEFQPFVDRMECEPDHWKVTILRVDANSVFVQHPWAGGMRFAWREIRRISPAFFGRSIILDARQIHLGNSIRTDFHRHLPDGTELKGTFPLRDIPVGKAHLTLNMAELEAGAADAPPASPFLAELRSGRLVTELFVNQQKVGVLNSLVRLKASSQHPDRIRIDVPLSLLKTGQNLYQLKQQPLRSGGSEYDDCELSDLRLEFDD